MKKNIMIAAFAWVAGYAIIFKWFTRSFRND